MNGFDPRILVADRRRWWRWSLAFIAASAAAAGAADRQRAAPPAHGATKRPPEGRGLAGEAAAATSDVAGEILGAPVHRELDGASRPADDLCRLKGVGPKFAERCTALGFTRFEQIAQSDRRPRSSGSTSSSARSAAASRATASSSRPTISRAATSTASSSSSASSSLTRFRPALRARLLLGPRGDQLVDLAAVHVDDLERPAVVA